MTAISYVRYDILKYQKNEKTIGNKVIVISVIISFALSLFWSGTPIIGWSFYSLEGGLEGVSCSVEYNEKSFKVISYNICMFIFVFILPFTVTIYTNLKSIFIVKLYNCLLNFLK